MILSLTTNEILGGFTSLIAAANITACIWLIFQLRRDVAFHKLTRSGKKRSFSWVVFNRHSARMVFGFIIKTAAIATLFALRIPLRIGRELGDEKFSAWWLDMSVYWESVCVLSLLVGLSFIMWPAFSKYARPMVTMLFLALACLLVYALGAGAVRMAAYW